MSALYLTEEDVCELVDMKVAIDVAEAAFRHWASGDASNIPRSRVRADGVMLHSMSAAAEYLGVVGWKNYTTTKEGARFQVGLYSTSGEMLALIDADHLGRLRTGAVSGVATSFMSRPESSVLGLFGAGRQSATQLQAICEVRKIERVYVYSRDADRCRNFAEEMSNLCEVDVAPAHSPVDVTAEKDIICTATTSRTPVFDGRMIDEGTHINAIGSNSLSRAEIDIDTVRRANFVVCDSVEQCKIEAGDFGESIAEGATSWSAIQELSDVVVGRKTGRACAEDVTLFKSVGLALQDVALAAAVYERAIDTGRGVRLPF